MVDSASILTYLPVASSSTSRAVVAALTISLWIIFIYIFASRRANYGSPYPPGPKGYWYIGLPPSKIPMKKPWLTYHGEWGNKYGDLIHFTCFGKHYLIINTVKAANDLLEKQARLTSDRPFTPLDEIAGSAKALSLQPYSDEWRKNRKLFHQNFRAEASKEYHSIEVDQINQFIADISSTSESNASASLKDRISTLSQKIMFLTVYGLEISSNKESMPQRTRELLEENESVLIPGWDGFKYIPFIHHLPSWLPGGHFKVFHQNLHDFIEQVATGPWNALLDVMESNPSHKSLTTKLLSGVETFESTDGNGPGAEETRRIKYMGFQAIAAAADTTMSAISTFFLAMSLYPNAQAKAQEELDNVLGKGKMPTFNDRYSLPYIEAVYREVMRWHPALPMGIAHHSLQDIFYNGYYIPKGTIIFANIWAMTHDPTAIQDPGKFIPERHLSNNNNDINSILAFGFGRRVCVGRYMANDTIWLTIASTLAAVNISSTSQLSAERSEEDYFSDGGFCSPKTLECLVSPRVVQS